MTKESLDKFLNKEFPQVSKNFKILDINNNHKIKTSKRLGFQFSDETNN